MTLQEKRKHIKPFLRFAIKELEKDLIRGRTLGLCVISTSYCHAAFKTTFGWHFYKEELSSFLKERLYAAIPKGAKKTKAYWWAEDTRAGIQKRIDFCKLQLKIVKP